MSGKGYTNIPDWMLSFDLDIYEVIILAVIFGFSQDGDSTFAGSQNYLARKAKCSRRKVALALPRLVENGLIEKVDVDVRGIHLCEYRVTNLCTGFTGCASGAQGGCAPHSHNNIVVDNNRKKNTTMGGFDFRSALLSIGVDEEVADSWISVRKTKRATNTEIAFRKVKEEISKSGLTANECITIAVENSWQGFKAEWLQKQARPNRTPKESVLAHNLKVMDKMYGTDMYGQTYGRRDADEQ